MTGEPVEALDRHEPTNYLTKEMTRMKNSSGTKILFIFHEIFTSKIIAEGNSVDFNIDFVANSVWASRPNSTTRLTLANYAVVKRLQGEMNIDISTDIEWHESLGTKFSKYDVIVLNAIAGAASVAFASKFFEWKRSLGDSAPFVVVGTEVTWFSSAQKGEISQQDAEDVYFGDLLLRHTARTDSKLYGDERFLESRVQEFELGIDSRMLPEPSSIEQRKRITLVRAPEGRITKNNAAIDELIDLVRATPELNDFEIVQLTPPYSIVEYWNVLASTTFLLFTSLGETFSYALNDAKALGVITLRTDQMYLTKVGSRFGIDTYPDIGIPYTGTANAVEILKEISTSDARLQEESARSRNVIDRKFSLSALYANWKTLLEGQSLNTERLFIYGESFTDWNEIVDFAKDADCKFLMPFENRGVGLVEEGLSRFIPEEDLTLIRYFLTRANDGVLYRTIGARDDGYAELGKGPTVHAASEFESTAFLHLLLRTYKIGHVVIDRSLLLTDLVYWISKIQVFRGISSGLTPLTFEFV